MNEQHKTKAWRRSFRPRVLRTTLAATLLLIVGLIAYRNDTTAWWGVLVIFTAALVIAESLELRVDGRPPIPVSFAIIMALARIATDNTHFSWVHAGVVVVASLVISTACHADITTIKRIKIFGSRIIVYAAGATTARVLFDHINPGSQLRYVALISTLALMLGIHEVLAWIGGYGRVYGFFAAAAHASIIAGGVLIGVGYAGTKGNDSSNTVEPFVNGLGVSALITCAIPLLVAWFAFSRYYGALKTYKQTIRALSAAPELGGIVAWGHADRVAKLALAIADKLDLDRIDRDAIETACYMHTLGDAVLDTTMDVDPYEEAEAAHITADIIRQSRGLDRVADIIDDHVRPYRGVVDGNLVAQNDIAASIMRVANDYDNISRREETWGIRALASMHEASTATYNPKALEALEWVLGRDSNTELIEPPDMPERVKENLYS